MRSKLFFHLRFVLMAYVLLGSVVLTAQITKPAPGDNPNTIPDDPWPRACASASFNEYYVSFTHGTSPIVDQASNEFILELSDDNGDFSSPVEVARVSDQNANFTTALISFALPTDTRGENYRFRVRSTNPAQTSPVSDPFPMYYIDVTSPITIREVGKPDFGDGNAQVCNGNPITLEVYGIANPETYQYNWFKSSSPVVGQKGHTLVVADADVGMYNAEIDYGSCSGSGNTLSNTIDITSGATLGVAINPPTKTDLCSGETATLTANITGQGLTYTWYKDGTAVTSPTVDDDTFIVDASVVGFEGDYQVEIAGSGICTERSAAITITNAGNFTVTRDNPPNMVILPSQTITLSVSTTAGSPLYQWYKDGNPVGGATNSSLDISNVADAGIYYAEVSQSGGACAATSINSETTAVVAPDSFEIVIDYATEYIACENTDMVLEVVTINAVDSDGNRTDVTADLRSSFTYQWKKDGTNVAGATSENISLTDIGENGDYEVDGTLNTYNSTSNSLSLQLLVNESLTISSTSLISCGSSEDITISTTTDLSGETFDWFRDGVNLNVASNTLDVTQPGTYQLVLQRNGCPLNSNEIVITPLDESLISLDPGNNIVFPEGGSRTVTASGGDTYRWLDINSVELSTSSSVTFTEEGDFILIAYIGDCEITRNLTVEYLDTFRVPNVITVNGDGVNDQWIIPNSYSNDPTINIIIYNDKGEEIYNVSDYQNNWPESSMSFPKQNMVFFYKIKNAQEVLKQGTITIIR